jgi:hypothetical protein
MAVTTSLSGGTLTITGDAAADDVAILGTSNAGEITLIGRNGTLIDGIAADPMTGESRKTIAGVTASLDANFGDGDNIINVDNVYLAGGMEVETETGDDRIILGATGVVSTRRSCILLAGDGNDVIRAEEYKVFIVEQLSVLLEGGDGHQFASVIGASSLSLVHIGGGSESSVEMVVRGVTSGGNLLVSYGAPVTSVAIFTSSASGNLLVSCPNANNSLYIDTVFAAGFMRITATASDPTPGPQPPQPPPYNIDATITIARCQTKQILIQTGGLPDSQFFGGNDTIFLHGNNIVGPPVAGTVSVISPAHVLYIETGDGNDNISASYNVAVGDWFISMSQLDDLLTLVGNQVNGFASADGGPGTNRLNLLGNQFGGFATTRFQ